MASKKSKKKHRRCIKAKGPHAQNSRRYVKGYRVKGHCRRWDPSTRLWKIADYVAKWGKKKKMKGTKGP